MGRNIPRSRLTQLPNSNCAENIFNVYSPTCPTGRIFGSPVRILRAILYSCIVSISVNTSANSIALSVPIKGITLAPKTESNSLRYLSDKPVKSAPAACSAINHEKFEN